MPRHFKPYPVQMSISQPFIDVAAAKRTLLCEVKPSDELEVNP